MNIQLNAFKNVLIILCILIFNSCKKEHSALKNNKIASIELWYQNLTRNNIDYLVAQNGKSVLIGQQVLWDSIKTEELENKTLVIIYPIKTNLFQSIGKHGNVNLVIHLGNNGEKTFKIITQFEDVRFGHFESKPSKLYEMAFGVKNEEMYKNLNLKRGFNEKESIHNRIFQDKARKLQSSLKNNNLMADKDCYDYWWVVKYPDGTESWEWLYESCGGETKSWQPDDAGGHGGENRDTEAMRAFENDYKNAMSTKELEIYNKMNRINQLTYLVNAKNALDRAASLFPGDQHNTKADAYRHAYFSIMNVYSFGQDVAKNLGDAHEENSAQPSLEKQMDLYNNNIGRNAYSNYPVDYDPSAYYSSVANNLISSGQLKYIKNGQLVPTNQ